MHAPRLLLVAALSASAGAAAQVNTLRPGLYEVVVDIQMGQAATLSVKPDKGLQCLTEADVKDAARMFSRDGEAESCKISDLRTSGNKVRFDTTCLEDGVRSTGSTEMTFGPDTVAGVSTMKDGEGRVVTMRMSGRRVGACPK